VTMLKNKCSVWKRIKFPTFWYNSYYFTWSDTYFFTIGDLTYQSPLVQFYWNISLVWFLVIL